MTTTTPPENPQVRLTSDRLRDLLANDPNWNLETAVASLPADQEKATAKSEKKSITETALEVPFTAPPDILTDQRIKYYFASTYKNVVFYAPGIGWHRWTGARWCTDMPGGLHPLVDQMQRVLLVEAGSIEDDKPRIARKKELLSLESHCRQLTLISAFSTVPALITEPSKLDSDPMLFNTSNCTVDLRTGATLIHNPDHKITRMANVQYDPEAQCPQFMAFLLWAMCGDLSLVAYLQRFIGYCLTGLITEQILTFWYGTGGNGKSTLMILLHWLMGDYAMTADSSLIMKKEGAGNDNNRLAMLAGLRGARIVTLSEVNDGEKLNEGAIKDFTGGEAVNACFKYEQPFTFVPQSQLFAYGNYKPYIRGTDRGIWRRIHLVPFEATISEAKKDPKLPEKLRTELPGILAWAVAGCLDWQRIGLAPPEAIVKATTAYRQSEDVFASWLHECCSCSEHRSETAAALLCSFKEFSGWNISSKKLGTMLSERGFRSQRVREKAGWAGLDLQNPGGSGGSTAFSGKSHEESSSEKFTEKPFNPPDPPGSDFFDTGLPEESLRDIDF